MTVNFYFSILYELHGKKKKEGNRELFSMCISGSVAWRGSLVLVLGQPSLSYDSPELAVYPQMPPCPRTCSPKVGAYSIYSLPICEISASVPSSFKECHPVHERQGQILACHPHKSGKAVWPLVYLWLMAPKCVCLETEQESMQTKVMWG